MYLQRGVDEKVIKLIDAADFVVVNVQLVLLVQFKLYGTVSALKLLGRGEDQLDLQVIGWWVSVAMGITCKGDVQRKRW